MSTYNPSHHQILGPPPPVRKWLVQGTKLVHCTHDRTEEVYDQMVIPTRSPDDAVGYAVDHFNFIRVIKCTMGKVLE